MSSNPSTLGYQPLTQAELATTLELANITGGLAGSTLAMLADEGLTLGQPEIIEYSNIEEVAAAAPLKQGVLAVTQMLNTFDAPIGFFIPLNVARALADVMMGGGGEATATELTDIQLSAIGEAISQMMAAIANNYSQMLSKTVEISPPKVVLYSAETLLDVIPECAEDGTVSVQFPITGSTLIPDGFLIQLSPAQCLRKQISTVQGGAAMAAEPSAQGASFEMSNDQIAAMMDNVQPAGGGSASASAGPVTVQQVQFSSFDNHIPATGETNKNLELVMDVQLNLTVELGRSELSIKDVLELTRGSVIELNRVAGEPVDLYANGKLIAKGEVVVIEDNFGLRITSIVSPADRLRGL